MATDEEIRELREKISAVLSEDQAKKQHFTPKEVEKLRRVITVLDRLEAFGWFSKWAFYGLLAAGAIIANWERIVGWWRGP